MRLLDLSVVDFVMCMKPWSKRDDPFMGQVGKILPNAELNIRSLLILGVVLFRPPFQHIVMTRDGQLCVLVEIQSESNYEKLRMHASNQ